jgi:hypothetical protein
MPHLFDLYNVHYKQRQVYIFKNTQTRIGDSGEFGERRLNMDYWALKFNHKAL